MANRDINVRFNLQNTEFNNNINSMNKQMKLCEQQIKTAATSINGYGNKIVALKDKQSALNIAIKSAEKNIKTYQEKIKATTTTLNSNMQKVEQLKNRKKELTSEYKKAVKELGAEDEKTKELKRELDQVSKEYKEYTDRVKSNNNAINSATQKMEQQKTKLANYKNELYATNRALLENSNNMLKWANKLDGASKKLSTISSVTGSLGKTLLTMSAPIIAFGAYSTKVSIEFEAAMSKVEAISGATGKDLEVLTAAAREMGEKTSKSATECAEALSYMSLAGWNTKQMLEGLEPILRLSEAAGSDLARTSDLVTDSMSAMGVETSNLARYLDIVAKAQNTSNTTADQMLEAYIGCGGMFRDWQTPLEESATLLGVLANRGIKSSEAGTSMNSILVNLIGTTKRTSAALETLGVKAYDGEGKFRGIETILKDCAKAMQGMTDAQKDQISAALGGKTQMDTFKALLSGISKEYDELKGKITDSDGALLKMAETMQDNAKGNFVKLKSQLEELGIQIGEKILPHINKLIEKLSDLIKWFGSLSEDTQSVILKFGFFAACTGGALKIVSGFTSSLSTLTGMLGKIARKLGAAQIAERMATGTTADLGAEIGTVAENTTAAASGTGLLTKALKFMKSPAGLVIGTMSLVGAKIYGLHKDCKEGTEALTKMGDAYTDFSGRIKGDAGIWDNIFGHELTLKFSDDYKERLKEVKDEVSTWVEEIKGLQEDVQNILNNTEKTKETKNDEINQLIKGTLKEVTDEYNAAKSNYEKGIVKTTYEDALKTQGHSKEYIEKYGNLYGAWYQTKLNEANSYYQELQLITQEALTNDGVITESEEKKITEIREKYSNIMTNLETTKCNDITNILNAYYNQTEELERESSTRQFEELCKNIDKETQKKKEKYNEQIKDIQNNTLLSEKEKKKEIEYIKEKELALENYNAYKKAALSEQALYDETYAEKYGLTTKQIVDDTIGTYIVINDASGTLKTCYFENVESLKKWAEVNGQTVSVIKGSNGELITVAKNSEGEIVGSISSIQNAYALFGDDVQKYMKKYCDWINNGQMTTDEAMNMIEQSLDDGTIKASNFGMTSEQFKAVAKAMLEAGGDSNKLKEAIDKLPNGKKINIDTIIYGKEELDKMINEIAALTSSALNIAVTAGVGKGYATGGNVSKSGIYNYNEKGIELADSITGTGISLTKANYEQAYLPSNTKVSNALLTSLKMKNMIENEVNVKSKEMYSAIKDLAKIMQVNPNKGNAYITMNNPRFDNKGSENANINYVKKTIKSMF